MEEIEGVKFLISGARMLVMYYYTLLSGAESNLKQLEFEVGLLRGFLAEASKREGSSEDERFRIWEREMSNVIHEADDVIDSCAVQAAAEKNRNIFGRTIGRLSQRNIKLAERVKSLLQDRVKPLLDKDKYDFVTLPINNNPAVTVHAAAAAAARNQNPRQKKVIPLVKERDALINGLTSTSSENYEVFSIVGMAGLGKSTMAWSIYHDPKIRKTFPSVIWVKISQTFNKKVVCLTILEELGKVEDLGEKNLLEMSVHELSAIICTCLEKGNFLLILDDVWTHEVWREITDLLPVDSKHKCKVLITTRVHEVAMSACTSKPYELRSLSEHESWELMQLDVFGVIDSCPPELVDLGKQVARDCDGLPFTIVMMAGVLKHRWITSAGITEAKEEWRRVSRTLRSYGGSSDDQEKRFCEIISLSFDTLMSHELKDCFLFMGMFPEGAEISFQNLVGVWIAQKYIVARNGCSMEEIAKDYWKELIDKSLLMASERKPDGEVKTCRVHDLIRNFCQKEAVKQGKNVYQEVKMSAHGVFQPEVEQIKTCRHICIHSIVMNFLIMIVTQLDSIMAYSFLSFSKETIILEKRHMTPFARAFKNLRVLHVKNVVKFPEFPAKLLLLMYVSLSSDSLSILPWRLSKLCKLQFLEIDTSSPTIDCKANIWKLVDLRHFKTKASVTFSNVNGKGEGGKQFQTLKMIAPESCSSKLFSKLKNLMTLGIRGNLTKLLDTNPGLENLVHLSKLELVNGLSPEDASRSPMRGLPQPNKFPPNVRTLKLSGTYLSWNNMSVLAQLRTLEVLKLKGHAFVGYCWDATGYLFNNLETLQMEDTDLRLWEASTENFPKLRKLVLINCTHLESVPDDLVKGLDLLHMEGASEYAVSWAQKIAEEIQQTRGQRSGQKGIFQLNIVSPEDEYKYTFPNNHTSC